MPYHGVRSAEQQEGEYMRVLNFGSLNLDYVYGVNHFVRPGETLAASSRSVKAGGKGLNQSGMPAVWERAAEC